MHIGYLYCEGWTVCTQVQERYYFHTAATVYDVKYLVMFIINSYIQFLLWHPEQICTFQSVTACLSFLELLVELKDGGPVIAA